MRSTGAPWVVTGALVSASDWGGRLLFGSGRDDTAGFGGPPSLRIGTWGRYAFRLACSTGAREVTVRTLQPHATAARPKLVIRANPDIGLIEPITSTAGAGADWVTIGPVPFTATADGGVWVELWNPQPGFIPCWFDDLVIN